MELLEHLRDHLIAQNIVRRPRDTTPAGKPPMWLEPKLGVPGPGEGQNTTEVGPDIVIGAYDSTGIANQPYIAEYLRRPHVELRYRSRTAPLARQTARLIYSALCDKRGWYMAGLWIYQSLVCRDFQRVGSDEQGYEYLAEYEFEVRTAA